jgi:hypothetical protein
VQHDRVEIGERRFCRPPSTASAGSATQEGGSRKVRCSLGQRTVAIFGLIAVVGCGGHSDAASGDAGTNGDAATCPITREARTFLSELTRSIEVELETATLTSSATDFDFSWTLVGTDARAATSAHVAMPCSAPRTDSGETCASDLPNAMPIVATVDTCFRLGCEAAAVGFVDVYVTQPSHRSLDDRAAISYSSTSPYPTGKVTYDPNPLTHWRYDVSQAGVTNVTAILEGHPSVSLASGGSVDLTFTGQATGTNGASSATFQTTLSFAHLSPAGVIDVTVKNGTVTPLSGAIVLGSQTLATIADAGPVWQGGCAN